MFPQRMFRARAKGETLRGTMFRGTQRFVSGNICSESLKSPAIFGFNCVES